MKLWLDDERNPKSPKIQMIFGAKGDEIWARTAAVAINYLKQGNIVSISLDHDLGPDSAGTGMDVAKWIEEQAFLNNLPRLAWTIHSKNRVGAKNIERALVKANEFWDAQE
jgi:hypothetical protein